MSFVTAAALLLSFFQNPIPAASFEGIFKSADRKFVSVQVEGGETTRMYLTRGTKFILNGKTAKAGDFHDGDKVTVEAERDARMNMLALKIENAK